MNEPDQVDMMSEDELRFELRKVVNQLLSAQAAIAFALNVEDKTWILPIDIDERLRNVNLSVLERHNAKVRSHGWNEGREHERKCAEAVRKPLVDAIEKAIRSLRFDCPSFVAGEIADDLAAAIADAKTDRASASTLPPET